MTINDKYCLPILHFGLLLAMPLCNVVTKGFKRKFKLFGFPLQTTVSKYLRTLLGCKFSIVNNYSLFGEICLALYLFVSRKWYLLVCARLTHKKISLAPSARLAVPARPSKCPKFCTSRIIGKQNLRQNERKIVKILIVAKLHI